MKWQIEISNKNIVFLHTKNDLRKNSYDEFIHNRYKNIEHFEVIITKVVRNRLNPT